MVVWLYVNKSYLLQIHTEMFTDEMTSLRFASQLSRNKMETEGDLNVARLATNRGFATAGC